MQQKADSIQAPTKTKYEVLQEYHTTNGWFPARPGKVLPMLNCKKCKKQIPDESLYCMWCGAPAKKNPKKKMYQRPDGLFEKVMTIDGKRVAFRAKTEKEVERKILAYQQKKESGPLFSEVADQWKEEHFKGIAYTTFRCYEKPIERAKEYFANDFIREIAAGDVDRFVKYLATQLRLASKTVSNHLCVVHMIFTFAMVQGILTSNPAEPIRVPRGLKKTSRRAPTDAEIEVVKNNVDKPFGLFYFFVLYTGCRRGEALAIQFKDIDRVNKTVSISKSLYHRSSKPEIKAPKTGAGVRTVPLLDVLAEKLPTGKPDDFLFGGAKPMYKSQVQRALESYQKITGLTITPHFLRHGYATILYDAGIDAKTAQGLLGHADYHMTLNTYTHISNSRSHLDAQKLNEFTQNAQ